MFSLAFAVVRFDTETQRATHSGGRPVRDVACVSAALLSISIMVDTQKGGGGDVDNGRYFSRKGRFRYRGGNRVLHVVVSKLMDASIGRRGVLTNEGFQEQLDLRIVGVRSELLQTGILLRKTAGGTKRPSSGPVVLTNSSQNGTVEQTHRTEF